MSRIRGIAALRQAGFSPVPRFVDETGAPVSEEQASRLRDEIEPALTDLAQGSHEHARRTIENLEVADLLNSLYDAHARGERSKVVLDAFLDTFERWLSPGGVSKVDRLFDQLDLDRAPASTGILLLATTRQTRAHFARRDDFFERLSRWLLGRAGRTPADVEKMLRGLRA